MNESSMGNWEIFLCHGGLNYVTEQCKDKTNWELEMIFKWTLDGAMKGNSTAQRNVGEMYFYGYGCEQNYVEAMHWYTMSASQGNCLADRDIGYMYTYGKGVKKNYKRASKRYVPYVSRYVLQDRLDDLKSVIEDNNKELAYDVIEELANENWKKTQELERKAKEIEEKAKKIEEQEHKIEELKREKLLRS
jgi:TPR repeat protein